MALSMDEQRMLAEIERRLAAEDSRPGGPDVYVSAGPGRSTSSGPRELALLVRFSPSSSSRWFLSWSTRSCLFGLSLPDTRPSAGDDRFQYRPAQDRSRAREGAHAKTSEVSTAEARDHSQARHSPAPARAPPCAPRPTRCHAADGSGTAAPRLPVHWSVIAPGDGRAWQLSDLRLLSHKAAQSKANRRRASQYSRQSWIRYRSSPSSCFLACWNSSASGLRWASQSSA